MSIRKFGTADDQRVALDREEDEKNRRTAAKSSGQWTEEDREALIQESTE